MDSPDHGEGNGSVASLPKRDFVKLAGTVGAGAVLGGLGAVPAAASDAEFIDHGPVGFIVYSRGMVSTADGEGDDTVLIWLNDGEDGWLGMVDVDTGEFEEFWAPLSDSAVPVGSPFASLLSSRDRYYICNRHFLEFDPTEPGFTFVEEDIRDGGYSKGRAMSMTEDDEGVIWAATYPDAHLFSFDPDAREVEDHGPLYDHPSSMYPRDMVPDDRGWLYVAFNPAAGQIVAYNSETGESKALLPEDQVPEIGRARIYRDVNGEVYGRHPDGQWYELYEGELRELDDAPNVDEKEIVTGKQDLMHRDLPSGRRVSELVLDEHPAYVTVTDEDRERNSRGMVSTADGDGDDTVLSWLTDYDDGWVGMIDVDTGGFDEFFPPIDESTVPVGAPFASLLSSRNRLYVCNRHFVEFDPVDPGFTSVEENIRGGGSSEGRAMSMTEDDDGVVWAATYPDAHLISLDPDAQEVEDHGPLYDHDASMYPRSMAPDDQGWLYVCFNVEPGQLVAYDSETGEANALLSEDQVPDAGRVRVYRDASGKVYGRHPDGHWYELYEGALRELDGDPNVDEEKLEIASGAQWLEHGELPSGRRVIDFVLDESEQYLVVEDPESGETTRVVFARPGEEITVTFDPSGGDATPMGVTLAPDGTLAGGTYLPHQYFNYDPDANEWFRDSIFGQLNTAVTTDEYVYFGQYTHGAIYEWDPDEEWDPPVETDRPQNLDRNPKYLTAGHPHVGRPYAMVAHPNGRDVVLGGTGGYGQTGGGLVFWDRETESAEVLADEEVIQWESTRTLAVLPDGNLLGGTQIQPASGGEQKAEVATLYILDPDSKEVVWSASPLEDAEFYEELVVTGEREVLGIVDRDRLIVFDIEEREIAHEEPLDQLTAHIQGPEPIVETSDGRFFLLFDDGTISEITRESLGDAPFEKVPPQARSYEVIPRAEAPSEIRNGGAFLDDRIYYGSGSNLYSWRVPPAE